MNKANLNFWLLIFYTIIGGLLIVLGFIELFKPNKILHKVIKSIIYIGVVGYFLHFLGLIGRWYISGHAPWSNGYEAIVFISWVGISAGLMLYRNANALIPAAGFMVAVIMMGFAWRFSIRPTNHTFSTSIEIILVNYSRCDYYQQLWFLRFVNDYCSDFIVFLYHFK